MNFLQHTRNELNLCLKQNRPNRSYRDTLLTTWNCLISRFLFPSALCMQCLCFTFFFFFILIFLQLLVRRILKTEGSRPTYRLLGYLSVFQLGISLLLAVYRVRKLRSVDLTFLVKVGQWSFPGCVFWFFLFRIREKSYSQISSHW